MPEADLRWLNEPPEWHEEARVLHVVTGNKTDFWRRTHYGFIRDDGHFRHRTVAGDFAAGIEVLGDYRELYDQAGLMLRLDERNWLKAGIEYVAGRRMLSVVVTREASDWSTASLPDGIDWLRLRLTREGSAVRVEWADGAQEAPRYALARLADFPESAEAMVGPMCCSPERAGFEARFRGFIVAGPPFGALHD